MRSIPPTGWCDAWTLVECEGHMKRAPSHFKIFSLCLAALCLSSLCGCGTEQVFPGGERPASETAVINGTHIFPFKAVDITRVDGKSLGLMNSNAVVLPGTHVISAHLFQSYGIVDIEDDGDLILEAQADHAYSLNGTTSKLKGIFWIEEADTANVVAGQKPGAEMVDPSTPSTSQEAFTRAEARLKGLRSGDAVTRASLGLHVVELSGSPTGASSFVAYGEGWIPSMSGRGALDLGRPIGIEGNTIYGQHVFGYVRGDVTLVPKYQLRTRATIVPDTEYQELKRQGRDQNIRNASFAEGDTVHFLKNVTIDAVRSLPFQGPPKMAKETLTIRSTNPSQVKEDLRAVYTKTSFEDAEAQLKRMPAGTETWDMVDQLGGFFFTENSGQAYMIFMKGFASSYGDPRWQLATESDIYEVWPFGYREEAKEVMKLSVIFRNGKLQRIVPYEPAFRLAPHLREQLAVPSASGGKSTKEIWP